MEKECIIQLINSCTLFWLKTSSLSNLCAVVTRLTAFQPYSFLCPLKEVLAINETSPYPLPLPLEEVPTVRRKARVPVISPLILVIEGKKDLELRFGFWLFLFLNTFQKSFFKIIFKIYFFIKYFAVYHMHASGVKKVALNPLELKYRQL